MSMFKWKLHGDGKTIEPGGSVAPGERLNWGRTVGLGVQHVVAMFGGTFVFPIVMGLNPQLAVMMSGVGTILFLLVVNGKVPSYVGTSAAFVGGVTAVTAQGGTPAEVTGAIMVSGVILALVGAVIHYIGASVVMKLLPPVITGGVVMLIGFNLAPVVASTYWPQDQWIAIIVMVFVVFVSVWVRGFLGRIAVFLGLVFGYVLSWVFDRVFGQITSFSATAGEVTTHFRVDFSGVEAASWIGFPPLTDAAAGVVGVHLPVFNAAAIIVMLPGIIALVAENIGHVKAVEEVTGERLDRYMGRAVIGDAVATVAATAIGGSPTTTHAENIGVMAATKVYSTAAYWVASLTAILFGLSPKFGALIAAVPGGVLGGITVVLYGMIGLLGAKIWIENRVDFSNPLNIVPVAAGLVMAIGNVSVNFTDDFVVSGIALGTILMLAMYHLARWLAPASMRAAATDTRAISRSGMIGEDDNKRRLTPDDTQELNNERIVD